MDMVTDFLLLAASATACLYCYVLSKRLKGLSNANEGLGAGIAALSQSAEEVKTAVASTKASADAAAARIETLMLEADVKAKELQALIDELADMGASVVAHAEGATKKYVDTLAPFLGEANDAAARLLGAIERAPVAPVTALAGARRPAAAGESAADANDDIVAIDDTAPNAPARLRRARSGAAA